MDFHYAQLAKYKTIEEILRDQRKKLKIGKKQFYKIKKVISGKKVLEIDEILELQKVM